MIPPLRELQRWTRQRLVEIRDVAGLDMAALKMVSKIVNEKRDMATNNMFGDDPSSINASTIHTTKGGVDVWAGLGLGSDVAAALEGRRAARRS
jgi:hypothetical protein